MLYRSQLQNMLRKISELLKHGDGAFTKRGDDRASSRWKVSLDRRLSQIAAEVRAANQVHGELFD
jgi:hypothetical protein